MILLRVLSWPSSALGVLGRAHCSVGRHVHAIEAIESQKERERVSPLKAKGSRDIWVDRGCRDRASLPPRFAFSESPRKCLGNQRN